MHRKKAISARHAEARSAPTIDRGSPSAPENIGKQYPFSTGSYKISPREIASSFADEPLCSGRCQKSGRGSSPYNSGTVQ